LSASGRKRQQEISTGQIILIQFKSGFTQRRDDATKGNKGIGLMLGKNYRLKGFSLRRRGVARGGFLFRLLE